jgi:hypothetical protein
MSLLLAPTEAQIDTLLDRRPDARILGIRSPMRLAWREFCGRRGRLRVAWCDSELEIRERLDAVEEGATDGIVVLTRLAAADLACDDFPRARLEETDRWAALRTAFRARDIDPRLRAHRWLADLLLDSAPPVGYPPAAGGVLDLETAWRAAQERLLGLPKGRADTAALLWWTLDEASLGQLAALPVEARARMVERLSAAGGPAATLVMGAAAAGRGSDAFAIGLICGVIFAGGQPQDDLRESAVRLEPLVGHRQVGREQAWSEPG